MNCQTECCVSFAPEGRRFFTKEEQVEMLKEYLAALKNEAQGVNERISRIEKEQ